MKKLLLSLITFAALTLGINELNAQAKRYVFFEHFTQASCGPCAAQNPSFQTVYTPNRLNGHHVAIHTSWPGYDPMYLHNTTESASSVSYYTVTGVPDMIVNGKSVGSPTSVNQATFDAAGQSPIRVRVTESNDGREVSGRVTIEVLDDVPAGNYVLKTAVVERDIVYTAAPGSNGEKEFPNVFRRYLGNGLGGEPVTLTKGQDFNFDYVYSIHADWKTDIYTLAWVVNTTTKEVLNSGEPRDVSIEAFATTAKLFQKAEPAGNQFKTTVINTSDQDVQVEISINADQPGDWAATYNFLGADYSDTQVFTVAPGTHEITTTVNAGSDAGIANYVVSVKVAGDDLGQNSSFSVISGVTDLVVLRPDTRVDFLPPYTAGMSQAGSLTSAKLTDNYLAAAITDGTLDGVEHLYYNIGWNFPAFNLATVEALKAFMDRGGNVLMAGQDVAWDVFDVPANGANSTFAQAKDLLSNYFDIKFFDDGNGARSQIAAETGDYVFGNVSSSTVTRPYGSTAIYPDRIDVNSADAAAIFHYNVATEIAGVRSDNDAFKTVYIGIGLEQFGLVDVATEIVRLSHDWFHGLITSTEFDKALEALQMSAPTPNPANVEAVINVNGNFGADLNFRMTDMNGVQVYNEQLTGGNQTIRLNTANLPAGVYFYHLTDGKQAGKTQKLVVVH
mgnify:CR=1 FL=1